MRRALALLCLLLAGPASGQDSELPAPSQALLLFRVLGYDRHLAQRAQARAREVMVIAVAWRTGDEGRRDEAVDALRLAALRYRVAGLPVEIIPVRWDRPEWAQRLAETGASVALVVGRLDDQVVELAASFEALQILAVGTSRASVEAGLPIGLVARGARASILVNLAAARRVRADLDSTLFTVAEAVTGAR